jgi:hypothetical protein
MCTFAKAGEFLTGFEYDDLETTPVCCTHSKVVYNPVDHVDGKIKIDRWTCSKCGLVFAPRVYNPPWYKQLWLFILFKCSGIFRS